MSIAATMVDSHGVKRKDTTVGPPLRILSLDGGGVRGYSMLIILQELMHRTFVEMEGRAPRRNEIPKPCDHFDLIVGTGTGGLIALMLGRMRLDIEDCKDLYVRMTKRVFETDKTIAGIPYRSTLFKASKLEDAIRDAVREHTVYADEGNDEEMADEAPRSAKSDSTTNLRPGRSMSVASRYSQIGAPTQSVDLHRSMYSTRYGNPNALLYDRRENRTKTAVTAVYRGTRKGGAPALLRSYDSRKETAPEGKCMIWQAGRATCATQLAFKPIQVGQSMFLDEGAGRYNPAPLALDEALQNEWPGRDIGVFFSIGTGKRPSGTNSQQHLWWEGFVSSGISDFAEARRRLISKIEGCEETHQDMIHGRLADRGVNVENYYRLNVEIGVGEFGMNEWNRLAEISTSTRMYLSQHEVQGMNISAAAKLGRICRHKMRWDRAMNRGLAPDPNYPRNSWELSDVGSNYGEPEPPSVLGAVELPAEDVPAGVSSGRSSHHRPAASVASAATADDGDKFLVHADEPHTYHSRPHSDAYNSNHSRPHTPPSGPVINVTPPPSRPAISSAPAPPPMVPLPALPQAHEFPDRNNMASPPPLPPKTPLHSNAIPHRPYAPQHPQQYASHTSHPHAHGQGHGHGPPQGHGQGQGGLPYPESDGPPPVVNVARKPEFGVR